MRLNAGSVHNARSGQAGPYGQLRTNVRGPVSRQVLCVILYLRQKYPYLECFGDYFLFWRFDCGKVDLIIVSQMREPVDRRKRVPHLC